MCSSPICNCGMDSCLNGGTFNPSTCSCDCPLPFSGSVCQNCLPDEPACGSLQWFVLLAFYFLHKNDPIFLLLLIQGLNRCAPTRCFNLCVQSCAWIPIARICTLRRHKRQRPRRLARQLRRPRRTSAAFSCNAKTRLSSITTRARAIAFRTIREHCAKHLLVKVIPKAVWPTRQASAQ